MASKRQETSEAILYARVSSEEQEREGYSIAAQLKLLRDYAAANGLAVIREFVETESAKEAGRAAFGEMVGHVESSPTCRTLLVEKTDRLTRNLSDMATVDRLMHEAGLVVHFVKEGTVLSRDARSSEKFIFTIKAAVAKLYVDNLREETIKGLMQKAAEGLFPGHAPFGYRNVQEATGRRVIEPVLEMTPAIVKMFEQYATGRYSLDQLARMAREEGLVSRLRRSAVPRATIHKMLRNPVYYGDFLFDGKLYPGKHAPLVSRELWDRVQEQLSARPGKHRQTKRTFAYAGGLITCGTCGCTITAELKKGKFVYYRCTGYKGAHSVGYLREEALTEQFATVLADLHFDAEVLEWIRTALHESHAIERKEHEGALARLQTEHKRLEDRLHAMYEDKLDGRVSAAVYDQKAEAYRSEQAKIRGLMDRHRNADDRYLDLGVRLLDLARRTPDLFRSSKPADKRQLLGFVLSNCTLADGKLSVTYRQPFDMLVDTVRAAKAAPARRPLSGARIAIWGG